MAGNLRLQDTEIQWTEHVTKTDTQEIVSGVSAREILYSN